MSKSIKIPILQSHFGWLFGLSFLFLGQARASDIVDVMETISAIDGLGDIGVLMETANTYAHATDNKLRYQSTLKGDLATFSGIWQAPALPEHLAGKYVYGLAVLSDDGCNVRVNNQPVLSLLNKPIALPDTANSLRILNVRLNPGTEASISLEYSNVKYTPRPESPDIDGCTLFAYLKSSGDVVLEKVGFGGEGFHGLCSDTTLGPYKNPQWTDMDGNGIPDSSSAGDYNDSFAYTKNTRPSIDAEFKVGDVPPNSIFEVKAHGSNGMQIPPTPLNLINGRAFLSATPVVNLNNEPAKWADTIKMYRKSGASSLRVAWSYRIDGGDWVRFASSLHQVYVTASTPTVTHKQETLFYYACNKPDGDSGANGQDVAHKIFEDFKTLKMKRVDRFSGIPTGNNMTFWPEGILANVLRDGTGVCNRWADFFNVVLGVHGYVATTVDVDGRNIIFNDNEEHDGSFWVPKGNPRDGDGKSPKSGQGDSALADNAWDGHTISFAYGEYYDPSYGIDPSSSKAIYEDSGIEWYGYPDYVDGTKIVYFFELRNPGTPEKLEYK